MRMKKEDVVKSFVLECRGKKVCMARYGLRWHDKDLNKNALVIKTSPLDCNPVRTAYKMLNLVQENADSFGTENYDFMFQFPRWYALTVELSFEPVDLKDDMLLDLSALIGDVLCEGGLYAVRSLCKEAKKKAALEEYFKKVTEVIKNIINDLYIEPAMVAEE